MKKMSYTLLSAVVLVVALLASAAQAKTLNEKVASSAPLAETVASPSDALLPIPAADSPSSGVVVTEFPKCDNRCIKYRQHGHFRKICCNEPMKMVLAVKDPCCCCTVDIAICVPPCCTDIPKICSHGGIFHRDIVEYTWCCGYRVKVIFDRCGDVTVHSYAR